MHSKTIEYQDDGVTLEAYVAYHLNLEKKRPAILIFHAWRGRDAFVCRKAELLAEMGYVGCAVDIYGKGIFGRSREENEELMRPFVEDRKKLQKRILAAFKMVQLLEVVDRDKIGAIGFCFGGLCALDLARSGADVKGVVSFHGLLQGIPGWKHKMRAKILALHGNDDPLVPEEDMNNFKKELTESCMQWQIVIYGHTMHAFTNPEANDPGFGTVYKAYADAHAWQAMKQFFHEIFNS